MLESVAGAAGILVLALVGAGCGDCLGYDSLLLTVAVHSTNIPVACVHCGGANEPCCSGPLECNGTNVCYQTDFLNSICRPCGVDGNPCCANNKCNTPDSCCSQDSASASLNRCVAVGSLCKQLNAGSPGVCAAIGGCACGLTGQPCCNNPPQSPCLSGLTCSSTTGVCSTM